MIDELEAGGRKETAEIERQIARLEAERERWAMAVIESSVPADVAARQQKELGKRLERLAQRRTEVVKSNSAH